MTLDVVVDARCLQDERFRDRGIGFFAAALLKGRGPGSPVRLIGQVDARLPVLRPSLAALFDVVTPMGAVRRPPHGFLCPSPMTHAALPFAPLLRGPAYCATILYDFIPHDEPDRYLADPEARLTYAARLAWLRDYDRFYSISGYTRERLRQLLGIGAGEAVVMGIPLRDSLRAAAGQRPQEADKFILVAGGDDWRKNMEAPVAAHARSALLHRARVRLVVFGHLPAHRQAELRESHRQLGGDGSLLEFRSGLTDRQLGNLYARATAMVAPSRIEGFSMPVVEAASFGCPVIAAKCGAHEELLPFEEDLFEPDDINALQLRMELLATQPGQRADAAARQAGLDRRFAAAAVCARFWDDFVAHLAAHAARRGAPAVLRGARPSIAFVTPMPPDRSGVADYSAATLAELGKLADVHLYTGTEAPRTAGLPLAGAGPLASMAYVSGRHDATVSVIGNSDFHVGPFRDLIAFGGAAIAHDARMLNFYYELEGMERTLEVAGAELRRAVGADEVARWLVNQAELPALFLDEVARAASPLFVHSAITARRLAARGLEAVKLPFSPYRALADAELAPEARLQARRQLRRPEGRMLIATFGSVMGDRAILDCIWAVEMLRSWGVEAELACIGAVPPPLETQLRNAAAAIGVADRLLLAPQGVSERMYRTWLQAADFAVQLRTYRMGGLSGALLDCIAAGLPTVANAHLAEAMEAPPWVRRVPDGISAVLIAEALLAMWGGRMHLDRSLEARRALMEARGFGAYARQLLGGLGFDPAGPRP